MSGNDKDHGTYVEKVREETQTWVRNLMHENHELRSLVVELRTEVACLQDDIRIRDEQKAALDRKLQEVRSVGEQYQTQYAQLEQHNANLANLYVASYQLHGTLDREAVLTAVQEIVVNLVGSEEFVIAERGDDDEFHPIAVVAVPDADAVHRREARIADAVASGETWIRPADVSGGLTACIPLKLDGRVTGYIAIFRLLSHKTALEPLDHELFDLLATHAATALFCTSLAASSAERRTA